MSLSDITKRMQATLGMDVISSGDSFERRIAESQFQEAIKYIQKLEQEVDNYRRQVCAMDDVKVSLEQEQELQQERKLEQGLKWERN